MRPRQPPLESHLTNYYKMLQLENIRIGLGLCKEVIMKKSIICYIFLGLVAVHASSSAMQDLANRARHAALAVKRGLTTHATPTSQQITVPFFGLKEGKETQEAKVLNILKSFTMR